MFFKSLIINGGVSKHKKQSAGRVFIFPMVLFKPFHAGRRGLTHAKKGSVLSKGSIVSEASKVRYTAASRHMTFYTS
jgi:hypothetical protein